MGAERVGGLWRGYILTSLALIGIYPLLAEFWRGIELLTFCAGAAACVAYGRRSVARGRRAAWTLLLWALAGLVTANVLLVIPDERAVTAGWFVDATANALLLAAALAMIIRRGARDLGGIVDAAVIAFAAGSLLWAFLPHRLGPDQGFPTQTDLFVVVFTLTGVLGALMRLSHASTEARSALSWLLVAIAFAISGNVVLAIGGENPVTLSIGNMLILAALTATGLFGLDPTGPRLVHPQAARREERLSAGRLAFLGVAVAVIPAIAGVRELMQGSAAGVLLMAQGAIVATLVMLRIGLLSAERARAEQALEHQASHDPLTLLPNRRQFVARLADELSRHTPCVLLFCDLDDFKAINDRFGHETGDQLLVEVARRLRTCVPPPHMVSRFGGDEFVVLLVDTTLAEARTAQACIEAALARPFDEADGAGVGISIGVSDTEPGVDAEQMLRSADRAMYREKEARSLRK